MGFKTLLFYLTILAGVTGYTQSGSTYVHDPVMIREKGTYYLFCTGMGISGYTSPDMKNWTRLAPVFDKAPAWTETVVPDFKGHIWAPDISFYNGQYYLYYSVSAFAKNTSAIGVATTKTLDPSARILNGLITGL